MEKLDKVTLLQIAKNLSDGELAKFCTINQKMKNFCSADNTLLWEGRLIKFLGPYYAKFSDFKGNLKEIMDKYRLLYGMNWRDYYLSTMKILDNHFIGLGYTIEGIDKLGREDVSKLVRIMEEEPFNVYNKYLFNVLDDELKNKLNQEFYRKLTEEEKRWISPDVMVSYILIGVITDDDLIQEILANKRMTSGILDIIVNTDDYNPFTEKGIEIIMSFLINNIKLYEMNDKSSIIKSAEEEEWFSHRVEYLNEELKELKRRI